MNIERYRNWIVNLCLVFLLLLIGTSEPVHAGPAIEPAPAASSTPPRTETLYFNGLQWDPVYGWNPYSTNNNNALAVAQQDSAVVTVWETPYIYNALDGKQYPLLADGSWSWNAAKTQITFQIKPAAHWNDGTPVTAEDVAYTWATHVQYETNVGYRYQDYIDTIEVVNPQTVRVKARLDGEGKAVNPLMVAAYLSDNYVVQKAWTQALEERVGGDAEALKDDPAQDFVASGPYKKYIANDTKVVLVRDDNYWGQHASMWGRLPVPKYLAHIIYADTDAGLTAFKAGEVDVSQQFIADVQDLWLVEHLPISTYYSDAPYGLTANLPTAYYNLKSYGLDQVEIRKAIAMAVDYDAIIANAMTNQSPTFTQVPRSIMNPTAAEQALYDHAAVASLQWPGNDIAGANALLNTAGIVDTDGDGWREYNGLDLSYNAVCPNGWIDWQAAIEVLAAVGDDIGIEITPFYPEWSEYQTVFTDGNQTEYDIFMVWTTGAGPTNPWARARLLMSSEYVGATNNWDGNWGGYANPAADALIQAIPVETDPAALKADYTELTRIYLTDVPSFALMYRPDQFYAVNESLWTGFPKSGDGTNPPVPPLDLIFGYSIAGLYNLDGTPGVTSSNRLDPSPTSTQSVRFRVTFSEAVTGVDRTDFKLTKTGALTGMSVGIVTGAGNVYTVTVNTGNGNGTLRLDVRNDGTIKDAGGKVLAAAFTSGQTYTVKKVLAVTSQAPYDGWLLESNETSNLGGTLNSNATIINLGDDATRKQYRGLLSFDTSSLPDNAVITKVTLKVRKQGIAGGGDPVTMFKGFMVDVKNGFFGANASLQASDFQAAGGLKTVGPLTTAPLNNWYSLNLTSAKANMNRLNTNSGVTQLRLRFKLDDNNNAVANTLKLYSGNAPAASRPQLNVEYYVP
jgi:peptide/nickel transport system substrate-binding protein